MTCFLAIAFALALATSPAAAKTIVLGPSPGGPVKAFMDSARGICARKPRVIITGTQQSAAAIRAVKIKQCGVKVCMRRGTLGFHLSSLGRKPTELGSRTVARIERAVGPLTYRLKSLPPSFFGIPRC